MDLLGVAQHGALQDAFASLAPGRVLGVQQQVQTPRDDGVWIEAVSGGLAQRLTHQRDVLGPQLYGLGGGRGGRLGGVRSRPTRYQQDSQARAASH